MHNNKKMHPQILEIILVILIAGCMIFLNLFTTTKLKEYEISSKSAVFVMDDVDFENEQEFAEEIMDYLPGSYKMIELYDEDLELLFQIQFNDEYIPKDDISNHPRIVALLTENEEGQTNLVMGKTEQNVYFKWLTNSRGEKRLLIVYSSIQNVENLWIFSLVCYLVIILVFVLLIRLHSNNYWDKINSYKRIVDQSMER